MISNSKIDISITSLQFSVVGVTRRRRNEEEEEVGSQKNGVPGTTG